MPRFQREEGAVGKVQAIDDDDDLVLLQATLKLPQPGPSHLHMCVQSRGDFEKYLAPSKPLLL
jgi:hypothetical protein